MERRVPLKDNFYVRKFEFMTSNILFKNCEHIECKLK